MDLNNPKQKMVLSIGIKVLIIDNDSLSRSSIASYLQKKGCYVLETGRPQDAIKALRAEEFDVVLLNLAAMKEESTSIILGIREIQAAAKIILLTSPIEISISIQCMKLGAFDDLLVPVDVEVLFSRVKDAWKKKQKEKKENEKKGHSGKLSKP